MYFDVTDKGPDQACRKRRTADMIVQSGVGNIIYIPGDCYMHMFHACVKDGLVLADELLNSLFGPEILKNFRKYFGNLSKVVNTWRERASEIMSVWERHFADSDIDVQKMGRRYPLSVVAGRWGSVEGAEDYLLLRGRERVVPVLLEVLSKHMKADTDTADGGD